VIKNSVYGIHFARCMNIFNSLLAQLVKYDVHTTRKINFIHAIFYHILSFYQIFMRHCVEWWLILADRLGYFERKHKFYDQKQLLSEITGHYSQQVVCIPMFYMLAAASSLKCNERTSVTKLSLTECFL